MKIKLIFTVEGQAEEEIEVSDDITKEEIDKIVEDAYEDFMTFDGCTSWYVEAEYDEFELKENQKEED